jgi:hypothetical protein
MFAAIGRRILSRLRSFGRSQPSAECARTMFCIDVPIQRFINFDMRRALSILENFLEMGNRRPTGVRNLYAGAACFQPSTTRGERLLALLKNN